MTKFTLCIVIALAVLASSVLAIEVVSSSDTSRTSLASTVVPPEFYEIGRGPAVRRSLEQVWIDWMEYCSYNGAGYIVIITPVPVATNCLWSEEELNNYLVNTKHVDWNNCASQRITPDAVGPDGIGPATICNSSVVVSTYQNVGRRETPVRRSWWSLWW